MSQVTLDKTTRESVDVEALVGDDQAEQPNDLTSEEPTSSQDIITIDCDIDEEWDDEDDEDASERRHSRFKSERFGESCDVKVKVEQSSTESSISQTNEINETNETNETLEPGPSKKTPFKEKSRSRNKAKKQFMQDPLRAFGCTSLPSTFTSQSEFNRFTSSFGNGAQRASFSLGTGKHFTFFTAERSLNPFPHRNFPSNRPMSGFANVPPNNSFSRNSINRAPSVERLVLQANLPEAGPETVDQETTVNNSHGTFHEPWDGGFLNRPSISDGRTMFFGNQPIHHFPTPQSFGLQANSQFIGQLNSAVFGNHLSANRPNFNRFMLGPTNFNHNSIPLINPGSSFPRRPMHPFGRDILEPRTHPIPPLQRHQIPLDSKVFKRTHPHENSHIRNSSVFSSIDRSRDFKPSPRKLYQLSENSISTESCLNKITEKFVEPSTSQESIKEMKSGPRINENSDLSVSNNRNINNTEPKSPISERRVIMVAGKRPLVGEDSLKRSSDEIEVVDLEQCKKSPKVVHPKETPMVIDLEIDEDYKRKLEEQKKLREEIIRRKEERRRQMVAAKQKQTETFAASKATVDSAMNQDIDSNSSDFSQETLKIKEFNSEKSSTELKAQPVLTEDKVSDEKRTIEIRGLANTTSKATISKLCRTVGPVESCYLETIDSQRRAIVIFESSKDALSFQKKYQRHLVDLCVIQVSIM